MEETTPHDRPVRVLVADDEAMVRAGVRAVLARDPQVDVVGEAGDGREAIALTRRHRPDVVLLDIQMPGLDGLTAVARLRGEPTPVGVIMLTTFGQDDYITRALEEGADGFLLKADDPRELPNGVRAVAAGGAYLSPRVAGRARRGAVQRGDRERTAPRRGHGESTRQRRADEAGRAQPGEAAIAAHEAGLIPPSPR